MSNEHIDKIIIKKGNFPILNVESSLYDAIFLMNKHKLGNSLCCHLKHELLGIFTDGFKKDSNCSKTFIRNFNSRYT